ncbi:MAG: TIGR03620 family F420-dependent LLM class oxidoreductase [bacterium]|nr:TIGR03620 family F420-dependent LLM class oxidoreductase [bacterium]
MMPTLERMGRIGAWTGQFASLAHGDVRHAAAHLESLGIPALWYGEAFGREVMALGSLLLESTSSLVVASGIANIYGRDATAMVNGARSLAEASGDRFVLGIGVSHRPMVQHRGHEYTTTYRDLSMYLEAMAAVTKGGPEPAEPVPVVVGALGPQMSRLAAARAQGVHPYFTPVSHTAQTRLLIGDSFLAPEQMVILTEDRTEARSIAAETARIYLRMANYRRMLNSQGLSEDDLDNFSDAMFDAVFAWGTPEKCVARAAEHLAAGADHVCVQVLTADKDSFANDEWTRLAPALLELADA